MMDLNLVFGNLQYAVPVGVVLICALLVTVFGFKKAEQPRFSELFAADRKQAAKKRTKTRDKKSVNGNAGNEKASPVKKSLPVKVEGLKKSKEDVEINEKKQEDNKKSKNPENKINKENKVEQVKNKKNVKNLIEKPVDFDEGDWEQAYSRKDKKNKKKEDEANVQKTKKFIKKAELINEDAKESKENVLKESSTVSNKEKVTGVEKCDPVKSEIKDKSAKDSQNKELKEKNEMVVSLNRISNDVLEKLQSNKSVKEEKSNKKKSKKGGENATTPSVVTPVAEPVKVAPKPVEEIAEEIPEKVTPPVEQIDDKKAAAFDELGDVWTEAKPQRKNKKKTRKDN